MATRYLLPCKCGEKLEIDSSQAGLEIACRCGEKLEVPSLRGIRQLETVDEHMPAKSQADRPHPRPRPVYAESTWGPRQGTMLAGGLIACGGLLLSLIMWLTRPTYESPKVDENDFRRAAQAMTLEQSFEYWEHARQGIDPTLDTGLQYYRYHRAISDRWRNAGFGLAGLGLVIFLAARFSNFGARRAPLE